LTTLVIDLALIAIVAYCTWRGYKNGLIRGVFGVVTLIAALILANITAAAYSEEAIGVLTPFVGGIVDSAMADIVEEGLEQDFIVIENESEKFGIAYSALRRIGLPESASARVAEMAIEDEAEGFLSDLIATKLSSSLSYVAVFGIAFLLLAILFAIIGNLIGLVFSLPGLKLIDIIAGIAFGFVKGLLIVLTIAVIVRYFGLVAVSTLEGTSILSFLVNNNIIANLLGI